MNVWLPLGAWAFVAIANPYTFGRVRAWWRLRGHDRRDDCEICGARPRRIWAVTWSFDDDDSLGGAGVRSFMTAMYCGRHRPSDAKRRPNPRR